MTDQELAQEIIARLNNLIEDPDVRQDIMGLIDARVSISDATQNHPTIQCEGRRFGFLGLLNGLVGVLPDGPRKGWGFIIAVYDDNNQLTHFELTENKGQP